MFLVSRARRVRRPARDAPLGTFRVESELTGDVPRARAEKRTDMLLMTLRYWVSSLVRTALVCLVLEGSAFAAGTEESLRLMAEGSADSISSAIGQLATDGSARSLQILQALEAQELVFDSQKTVFIAREGQHVDALSGAPGTPQGALEEVRLNNVLRRRLGPALAQLRLVSPDLAIRLEAATELAKRPTEELRGPMELALSREKDSTIVGLLRVGLAQVDLGSASVERKLAALAVLKEDGDISHRPDLERMTQQGADGTFAEPDAQVRRAASAAIASIDQRVLFINLFANLLYGLSLGSVLLLAALGLAITFGLMKVINMAHGEMLMIGAYTTFVVQGFFVENLPTIQDYYLLAALPAAFCVSGAVGLALERGVIRHLYGRPLETLLATWGISLLLIQLVRQKFGAQNVTVSNPSWLSGGWELMPNLVLPYSRIATIGFVTVVVAFVWLILNKTRLGLYVRAVTQNRAMAGNIGIPTSQIDMWTFVLGSGVAGLGGVALSQLGNVGPELGQGYIVDSFMVVVLGGVGSIFGTVVGAVGLGLANKLLEPAMGAVLGKIAILVLLVLFIQKRPQGIFALKGRAAEL
jgi:urea transport system permease protein